MSSAPLAVATVIALLGSAGSGRALESADATRPDATIVARVNGEPIPRTEFQRMLGNPLTRSQVEQELGVERVDAKQLEHMALRRAIHHRLMLQEAARRNLTVSRDELEKAIAALRRRFEDLEFFGKWMKEQQLDDRALFEAVRADILAGRVWASLAEGAQVTEDQAREYYDAHKDELVSREEVRLRIIAVQEKAEAEEILATLKEGVSFSELARQRSAGLRSQQGGDTGWIDARSLAEPLAKAVPLLKPGDVAGPLANGSGAFLLVGLEGRRGVKATSLAEARAEIDRRLLPARRQAAVLSWLAEVEKKSRIEILQSN